MPIAVNCGCGEVYQVRDEFAGRQVQCVGCGRVVTVPPTAITVPPPTVGPRLRLPETPPVAQPVVVPPRTGLPVGIVFFLLLMLGGLSFLVAFNFDRIGEMLGIATSRAEDGPDPDPDAEADDVTTKGEQPPPKSDEKPPAKGSGQKVEVTTPAPRTDPVNPPFEGHAGVVLRVASAPTASWPCPPAAGPASAPGRRPTPPCGSGRSPRGRC
jgi:hypothetical protein